jgi:MoaA/NifB/PqqE/SkfB family radical SAM enzyme
MSEGQSTKTPRLPLSGVLELTLRCNNNCRHCWLRLPPTAAEARKELALDEVYRIIDEARAMGCRSWQLTGGEPMLRPDFAAILEYVQARAPRYALNTNGTLITPEIARLLARKGRKLVSIYGATDEVHDSITRNPGSFEAALRGCAYLKEAGADFAVQLVPMRDNIHQMNEMIELAKTLSPHWRDRRATA